MRRDRAVWRCPGSPVSQDGEEFLGRDERVGVPHELADPVPIGIPVDPNTDPAGRAEVSLGSESKGIKRPHDDTRDVSIPLDSHPNEGFNDSDTV